jgi:hypothetical protein
MKLLVLLLALANLTLFAYIVLDRWSGREPERLEQQLNRDRVKVLTPQQVAALGPSKAAALPNVCAEWGPFAEGERERAAAVLEPFQLGSLLRERRIDGVASSYWVILPPLGTRAAAVRRVEELRAAGFGDAYVVDAPDNRNAVSLGLFKTEETARRLETRVRDRGFAGVQVVPRAAAQPQTVFVVRDPQPALLARIREAQAELGNVEVKTGPCPPAS